MMQNHVPLIRAIIDAFLFLESSGDSDVNPDSAVRCMENMSSSLLALETSDQVVQRLNLQQISAASSDAAYSAFVRELPDMIGLASGTGAVGGD
jgi:hypothetical protein